MSKIEDYFIKDIAEEGIEIPLGLPGQEKATDWIRIRGVDSDPFRNARAVANRKHMVELLELKKREKELSKDEIELLKEGINRETTLDIICSLVISWSFDTDFTPENVKRFLFNCPDLADRIDGLARDRQLFFERKQSSSKATSATKSNSRKSSKARKAASKRTSKRSGS